MWSREHHRRPKGPSGRGWGPVPASQACAVGEFSPCTRHKVVRTLLVPDLCLEDGAVSPRTNTTSGPQAGRARGPAGAPPGEGGAGHLPTTSLPSPGPGSPPAEAAYGAASGLGPGLPAPRHPAGPGRPEGAALVAQTDALPLHLHEFTVVIGHLLLFLNTSILKAT